jgi:hypothetical protein
MGTEQETPAMSDEKEKEDLPRFRVFEKKVDSSWKEEVRKERAASSAGEEDGDPKAAGGKAAGSGKTPKESKIFVHFLASMIQQGLMQLGRMENPFTGQREVDIEGARYTIDILTTLQEKTAGNLAPQEDRVLKESIRDLRFQFIEISKAVEKQVKAQGAKTPGQ